MATQNNPKNPKQVSKSTRSKTPSSLTTLPGPVQDAIDEYKGIIADLSGPAPVWCYGKYCLVPEP